MRGKVLSVDSMEPISRGGGIRSYPFFGDWTGAKQMVSGMSIFPPGTVILEHTHNVEEIVVVIEGTGNAIIDGCRNPVKPISTTWIPAEVPHYFENTGSTNLTILWFYGEIEVVRRILSTGEVIPHLSDRDRSIAASP